MASTATRAYWPAWMLATAATGIVAGFFLAHALLLGRCLDHAAALTVALGALLAVPLTARVKTD